MQELAIAVALVAVLLAGGLAVIVPWEPLLQAGTSLSIAGFALGVPAGIVYHVLLYRALNPRGALPRGWIWRPIEQNANLRPGERGWVLAWCYTGAFGFGLIALGLAAFALSLVSVMVQGV